MLRILLFVAILSFGFIGYIIVSDPVKNDFENACITAAREAPLVGGIADESGNRVRWCGCMARELSKEVGLSQKVEHFFSGPDMRGANKWEAVFGYFNVPIDSNASFVCGQQPYFQNRWW